MIWFTSDLHLGHAKVIDFCNRPFRSVEEMDEAIIARWHFEVMPDDLVYVLGDVCFHKAAVGIPTLAALPGRKVLIQGNHDKWSRTQYMAAGFATVLTEAKINLGGWSVRLSHYPYWEDVPANDSSYEPRYPERRPPNDGGWLLCGHVHDKWQTRGRMINVGVDQWDFTPVSARRIETFFARERDKKD